MAARIHINNTNPILVGSPERRRVEAAGWEIAEDGMEIALVMLPDELEARLRDIGARHYPFRLLLHRGRCT